VELFIEVIGGKTLPVSRLGVFLVATIAILPRYSSSRIWFRDRVTGMRRTDSVTAFRIRVH
jgi:hypothetical protein